MESENNERCSTWNIFSNSASIIIFTGVIQSIVGIWQFVIQKSIGLTWLKESILSPDISGVAKVVFGGEKYIRAYGLFPHPNILGGFLVLSITLTLAFLKPFNLLKNLKNSKNEENMINPSQNVPRGTFNGTNLELQKNNICSTWNIWLDYFILGIQLLALFLTFSKSAWIGVTIALAYVLIRNVPRGTLRRISEKNFKYFALIGGIIILLIFLVKPDWHSIAGKSIDDRIFYLNVSRGTFFENPVFGVGSGQFVLNLETIENIQEWQFQPVHNVFLLILNELGIIGLCLFVWFVRKMIRNVPRGTFLTNNYLSAIFFGFLFIMLFDHYFWDIQQGQIMLWFVLGLLSGGKMWTSKKFNTYPQDKAK
ncbi:MAG: O-antigen ligase family protein [Parcubacteria group bacterium]